MDEDYGFIIEEDQSDNAMPSQEDWQAQYNHYLRRGWFQGRQAAQSGELTVEDNPYVGREGLVPMTCALGWEDGFVAEEGSDCPFPESVVH